MTFFICFFLSFFGVGLVGPFPGLLVFPRSYGHPAALAAARFVAPPCEENGEIAVLDRLFPARPSGATLSD